MDVGRQPFILADALATILFFASIGISVDFLILLILILPVPYLLLTGRKDLFPALLLAFAMSLAWGIPASSLYVYKTSRFVIGPLNLYPICYWAMGLFGAYFLFRTFRPRIKRFWMRWLSFSLFFWTGLVVIETVSYHVFGLKDLATANYCGLPVLDCIHGPLVMKAVYFTMGSLYFLLLALLEKSGGVMRRHIRPKKTLFANSRDASPLPLIEGPSFPLCCASETEERR